MIAGIEGRNRIGDKGCGHLIKGQWDQLVKVDLGTRIDSKQATRSATRGADTSARVIGST